MQQIIPSPLASIEQEPKATRLSPIINIPADRNPALVYLASLALGSRRTMRQALDTIATILAVGRCNHVTLPWGALRFQHTQAVRAALQEKYSAATANNLPFLPSLFRSHRKSCLDMLAFLQPTSTSTDTFLEQAIAFVLQHRDARAAWLPLAENDQEEPLNLSWVPNRWCEGAHRQQTLLLVSSKRRSISSI